MHQQEKRTKKQPAANNKKWRQAYIKNGNYILLYTITKIIKGYMIMYPLIILYNSVMITFFQKVDL